MSNMKLFWHSLEAVSSVGCLGEEANPHLTVTSFQVIVDN